MECCKKQLPPLAVTRDKSFWVGALGCCMPNLSPRGVSRSIFWVWLGTRELESWGMCPLRASVLEL